MIPNTMSREELLLRRSLLEAVIRRLQNDGDDTTWRKPRQDNKPSIAEQYEQINEALKKLESPTAQAVGINTGIVSIWTNSPKENKNG